MSNETLHREIDVQLEQMRDTVQAVLAEMTRRQTPPCSTLELAGFGTLLANLYSGTENILKRVAVHEGLALPSGPRWHAELFNLFTRPLSSSGEPFFTQAEVDALRQYRNFRHVMMHGDGVALQWEMMAPLVDGAAEAFNAVVTAANRYIGRSTAPGRPWLSIQT